MADATEIGFPTARWNTIAQLIEQYSCKRVAEIGVADGATALPVLKKHPDLEEYVVVDLKIPPALRVVLSGKPVRFLEMSSLEAVEQIEPGSLDLVFINADHNYESAKADIVAWQSRVKNGGIICGHDYWKHPHPLPHLDGVKRAVDEAFADVSLVNDSSVHPDCYVWWSEM